MSLNNLLRRPIFRKRQESESISLRKYYRNGEGSGRERYRPSHQKEAYAYYLAGAVYLDGPELGAITDVVRDTGVFTYLGITERSVSGGTVYATLVAIDPTKGIVSAHRKLMPTHDERMAWGIGDGNGLRTHEVCDFKVSGLNCWEN